MCPVVELFCVSCYVKTDISNCLHISVYDYIILVIFPIKQCNPLLMQHVMRISSSVDSRDGRHSHFYTDTSIGNRRKRNNEVACYGMFIDVFVMTTGSSNVIESMAL